MTNHARILSEMLSFRERHRYGYVSNNTIQYWMVWFETLHIEYSSLEEYFERIVSLEKKVKEVFWDEVESNPPGNRPLEYHQAEDHPDDRSIR